MIERIYKYSKYVGIGFIVLDALYVILTALYFSLTLTNIMSSCIWFIVVSTVVLALNLVFTLLCIVVKKLRKY